MPEEIKTQLQQMKLSSLKGKMVQEIFQSQKHQKKVENVAHLLENARFLRDHEERKKTWLAVLDQCDEEFLDQLAVAVVEEDLRFKKGNSNIIEMLERKTEKSQSKDTPAPLTDLRGKVGKYQHVLKYPMDINMPRKRMHKLKSFTLTTVSQENMDRLFVYLTLAILHEFFARKEEYVGSRAAFLQQLQNGIPQSPLEANESRAIDILQEARKQGDKSVAAIEILSFWSIAVVAIDAVVFEEIQKELSTSHKHKLLNT